MTRVHPFKLWLILIIGCLLYPTGARAGAKDDLAIVISGPCSTGGVAFAVKSKNSTNSIHATVTQTTVVSGKTTMSTFDVSLQPKQQQQLGCASQGPAGNFLTTWQVQSAQYQ